VDPARRLGFRSGLEDKVAKQLETCGVKVEYETTKIKYVVPESLHTYTPDFRLPNGILVETKGRFVVADRKKHLLIKQQYPDLDIRFVFSNSKTKINKGSPTSYADWCIKNGFQYSDKRIPDEWLKS
jgi:sugar lactone lactonase YvrE